MDWKRLYEYDYVKEVAESPETSKTDLETLTDHDFFPGVALAAALNLNTDTEDILRLLKKFRNVGADQVAHYEFYNEAVPQLEQVLRDRGYSPSGQRLPEDSRQMIFHLKFDKNKRG